MTAINIIRQRHAVHMVTDGAGYDSNGVLLTIAPKAWALPHVAAVIAARGPKLFIPVVIDMLAQSANSYDELKAKIVPTLESGCARLGICDAETTFEIAVAGWSETQGPDSYLVANHDRYGDVPPWTVTRLGDVSIAPSSETIHAAFIAGLPAAAAADDLDPEREGLRLLSIQRETRVPVLGASGPEAIQFIVGGFAQLTTIDPTGISTKILHRWPDRLGEKITPNGPNA